MQFLQSLIMSLTIAVSSLITVSFGFFHVAQRPPVEVSPAIIAATTTSSNQTPTIASHSITSTTTAASNVSTTASGAQSNIDQTYVVNPYDGKQILASQLADCEAGSPVYDLEDNPSAVRASASSVYETATASECCPLVGADPKTFVALDYYYGKDATGVWGFADYPGDGEATNPYQILGADPATFTLIPDPLNSNPYPGERFSDLYTKDKNHVYYIGNIVVGADPATFTVVAPPPDGFACQFVDAQDANHQYLKGVLANPPLAGSNKYCPSE